MSIYIFILLIAVILFVIRQRAANAKSEYTEELQLVVQRMRKQSEQLAKAREVNNMIIISQRLGFFSYQLFLTIFSSFFLNIGC